MELLKGLLERRIARYLVAYLAAGWAALEGVDLLRENGVVPDWIWRATFAFFLSGLPGALIVSWFHGAKGRQTVPPIEKALLGVVAVLAVVVTGVTVRSGLSAGEIPAGEVELAAWEDPARVAVLYFDDRGGADAEFLATGLTEGLIDELARVEGLTVVSSSGSRLFRGRDAAPDSIGRALEVGTLVQGSVAMSQERVRVTVALVRAEGGDQYASTNIERPRTEVFDLQDELTDTVAVFLRRMVGRELGDVRLRRGTHSVDAWELVQRAATTEDDARDLIAADDHDGAERAMDHADSLLAAAEAADPGWVEPATRRGWLAYRRSRLSGLDRSAYERWTTVGLNHAQRALQVDSRHAAALELRGTLRYWRYLLNLAGDHDEADLLFHSAEADFRAAIASDRNRAGALTSLSHLLLNKGERAEASIMARRAYEADRFLENANLTLWRQFSAAWDTPDEVEAQRACDEGRRRFPDDFRFAQCELQMLALPTLTSRPSPQAAWAAFEDFVDRSPPQVREVNRSRGLMYVAMALARAELADSARAVALRGRASPSVDPVREVALLESVVRVWLGDVDESVSLLTQYLAANPGAQEGFREGIVQNSLPWYQKSLADNERLRSLLGVS